MSAESPRLVAAHDTDYEFSYQVKKAAEGELIRKVFGWDEAKQRDFHQREWMERRPSVIESGGVAVGTMSVTESDGYVDIGQFFILPEYQNKGIGSRLLGEVLRKADKGGTIARLAFLRGNRAEALYRRNGFGFVRQTETHCYMERRPRTSSQPAAAAAERIR